MEEVDKIIIHSLRDIGCDIEDDIRSLGQFKTELVIESTVRCLEIINKNVKLPKVLPQNMAAKFHVCASIAESCKAEGYNGEIGYQTFLYSSGPEVRKVLMFLIDKLPRESEKTFSEPEDPLSKLKERIGVAIHRQLGERLKPGSVQSIPFSSSVLETGIFLPGKQNASNPQEWREYCRNDLRWFTDQCAPESFFPSVVRLLDSGLAGISSTPQTPRTPLPVPRPRAKPRSTWLALRSAKTSDQDQSNVRTATDRITDPLEADERLASSKEDDQEAIKNEISDYKRRVSETELSLKVLSEKLDELKKEKKKLSSDKLREVEARRRAMILLSGENSNESIIKEAKERVEEVTQRITDLSQQWDKCRVPLIEKIRSARKVLLSNHNENERLLESLKEMKELIDDINKEVAMKNVLKTKCEAELAKLPRDINRSMYTRRIMEIIGNIKKQKDDIDKILVDTRQVQKEINQVTGRLERSFTLTNEQIFKNALKDESSRKAYKLLATLHSDCADIVALIQETGVIVREISDIEEQIETESSKKIGASLERISIDLKQMLPETEQLKAQLAALSS